MCNGYIVVWSIHYYYERGEIIDVNSFRGTQNSSFRRSHIPFADREATEYDTVQDKTPLVKLEKPEILFQLPDYGQIILPIQISHFSEAKWEKLARGSQGF
jgi:hypothetical protein